MWDWSWFWVSLSLSSTISFTSLEMGVCERSSTLDVDGDVLLWGSIDEWFTSSWDEVRFPERVLSDDDDERSWLSGLFDVDDLKLLQ